MKLLSTLTAALLLGSPALADNPDAGKMAWYYCVAKNYRGIDIVVVQQESEFGTDASAFLPGNENYEEIFVQGHFDVYMFELAERFYSEDDDYRVRAKALFENRDQARVTYLRHLGSRPVDTLDVVNDEKRVFGYTPRPGATVIHYNEDGKLVASYNLLCEEPWSVDAQ